MERHEQLNQVYLNQDKERTDESRRKFLQILGTGGVAAIFGFAGFTRSRSASAAPQSISSLQDGSLGLNLDLSGTRTWKINGSESSFIPVPHNRAPVSLRQLIPMKPDLSSDVPEEAMRKSIWDLDTGESMIIGALTGPTHHGVVRMARPDDDRYELEVIQPNGNILFRSVSTGLHIKDQSVGLSEMNFTSIDDPVLFACECEGTCTSWGFSFYQKCEWDCEGCEPGFTP